MTSEDKGCLIKVGGLVAFCVIGLAFWLLTPTPPVQHYDLHAFTDSQRREVHGAFVLGTGGVGSSTDLYWHVLVDVPGVGVVYRQYLASEAPLVWSDTPMLEAVPKTKKQEADFTRPLSARIRLFVPEDSVTQVKEIDLQ